mmetsp:Transcript_73558/g.121365  ORF Transcript_73558/g.121365 Transcript_73558/m.121365 type:complete len:95 (+) Transcript_73558:41-325(+)
MGPGFSAQDISTPDTGHGQGVHGQRSDVPSAFFQKVTAGRAQFQRLSAAGSRISKSEAFSTFAALAEKKQPIASLIRMVLSCPGVKKLLEGSSR